MHYALLFESENFFDVLIKCFVKAKSGAFILKYYANSYHSNSTHAQLCCRESFAPNSNVAYFFKVQTFSYLGLIIQVNSLILKA